MELDDWTWGEMKAQIRADQERQRREGKALAFVAVGGARYVSIYLSGGQIPELADVFPFWSEEERKHVKLTKYQKMMRRLAGGGVRNG